ncbi:MAG: RdgB/HAM1 family non-canonical purine NTP pyrophosphatase [Candidatus Cloacimonadaceae bacterium]|jgi:XTP/dITP diphosphohydrolase
MKALLLATHNPDKVKEIRDLLKGLPVKLYSLLDFDGLSEVIEDEPTILGNATKKALQMAKESQMLCLADDTGLFIEALEGEPGVYSARWAGPSCSYQDNRLKALKLLDGIANRQAEFRTVVALAAPDGIIATKEGVVAGSITTEERGEHGFGYDAIFEVGSLTYAEMTDEQKNTLSHRALAIQAILPIIETTIKL